MIQLCELFVRNYFRYAYFWNENNLRLPDSDLRKEAQLWKLSKAAKNFLQLIIVLKKNRFFHMIWAEESGEGYFAQYDKRQIR